MTIAVGIEPDQHGRVAAHLQQEGRELPERVLAEECILVLHQRGQPNLGDAGGEMIVPEQRHPLAQRRGRLHHAIDPERLVFENGVIAGGDGQAAGGIVGERVEVVGLVAASEEPVHGCFGAVLERLLQLLPARRKRCTAKEMSRPPQVPGPGRVGLPGLPGLGRVQPRRGDVFLHDQGPWRGLALTTTPAERFFAY